MPDVQIIIEQALPTAAQLRKYPILQHMASMKMAMVEDVLKQRSEAGLEVDPAAAGFSESLVREAVDFYNLVVRDGRFVSLLGTDARAAANLLGVTISDGVLAVLAAARRGAAGPGGPLRDYLEAYEFADPVDIAIGIAVGIGIGIIIIGASISAVGPHDGGPDGGPPDGGPPDGGRPDGGPADGGPPDGGDGGDGDPILRAFRRRSGEAHSGRRRAHTRVMVVDRSGQIKL
jgi:hypothetical protein